MRIQLSIIAATFVTLASCSSPPPRVASNALAGSWRNSDGVTMTCEDTGLVVLDRPGPKQRPVVGEYTFDGSTATFRNRVESKLCADELGQYTVDVSTDACTITPVRDACADRVKLLKGVWTRTAAGRVTTGE